VTHRRFAESALKAWWLVFPVLTVIAFVAVEMQHVASMITVNNVDYFPMVDRALQLSFHSLDGWVNSKQPVGHSLLIRAGLELGWDAERVGQALSVMGGILLLCGTYLLAYSVFRDKRFAAIALAFVAAMSVVLMYSSIEGNDMLAAGLQVLSLGLLTAAMFKPKGLPLRMVFLAGLMAGLAYLIRYNGMITAMVSGLVIAVIAVGDRRRENWKVVGIYIAAFLLGSALQWVPSLAVTGNPFYADQGQNLWALVNDKFDFLREWQQAPVGITVFQVFAANPARFIQHWWFWFKSFWIDPSMALLDAPLKLFGQAGLVFLLLAPGPASGRQRGLIGIFSLAHLVSISMMKLTDRYLIMLIPLMAVGALDRLVAVIPPHWEYRRMTLPFSSVVLLAGWAWAALGPFEFAAKPPASDSTVIQASNALHAAGMRSASEVLSTHLKLQDASSPARLRFVQAYWATPEFASVADLVQAMRSQGWRFFIYHRDSGAQIYPGLQKELSPDKCPPGLVPIYFHENGKFAICRLNESSDGYASVGARLEGGIVLEGYEAHLTKDFPAGSGQRLGVYLHWRTESKINDSLKVFVHLLDAQGQPVAQNDDVPVLWTYPTNEWKPGEVIIDFHELAISVQAPPGEYTLQAGLYDDASGARLKRVDASGNPIADTIVLTKINIK